MLTQILVQFITIVLALVGAGCAGSETKKSVQSENPWAKQTTASLGTAQSIGAYESGCLQGALSLPLDGPGFHLMRVSRGKIFGHPKLIDFLKSLATQVNKKKLGDLFIADLSQPRGGPAPSGHRSHQIGLDVDLWFWQPSLTKVRLSLKDRENTPALFAVNSKTGQISYKVWSKRTRSILRLMSEDPRVDRIFVNPALKRDLCKRVPTADWIHKIRPWWGHDFHFHVRLSCPSSDGLCVNQNPIPSGNGCDETLQWWFSEEAKALGAQQVMKPEDRWLQVILPAQCAEVLRAPPGVSSVNLTD